MENIKKALQRAKQEKPVRIAERLPLQKIYTKPDATENIEYSQTRIVKTNRDRLAANRVITGLEYGEVAVAYKMLRTRLLHRMRDNDWNSLAITSPSADEGKTLTAINLAISLAMEVNQTILLVDMDLRRPSIHQYFGYKPKKGLSDYILSDTPLSEIMFNPSVPRLVVLPGTKPFANSSEMLSSPRFVQLIEELKERYSSRLVLFDLPPLLSADDAIAFSPYVDATLLVLEEGKTKKEDLMRSREVLGSANIIGTVLNKADVKNQIYY